MPQPAPVPEAAAALATAPVLQSQRILLKDCADPPAPDSVLPGLYVGSVGIVAGWGDVNMSALALQIGAGVVLGKPITRAQDGHPTLAPQSGSVAVVLGTDPPDEVRRQMANLRAGLGPSEVARADSERGLYVYSTCGEDMRVACQSGNRMVPGPWRARLRELATGHRLVVIDQLVFLHDGAIAEGASTWHVMQQLARVAVASHCAILVLQHLPRQPAASADAWDAQPDVDAAARAATERMQYVLRGPTAADVERLAIGRHARHCWLCVAESAATLDAEAASQRLLSGGARTGIDHGR
ncbi:MAG TPA: AAA family ATPase [Rhodanobacteraceae bacterium]|nr:AAA family ATPase [Rhodanobacteraceae bacterium]